MGNLLESLDSLRFYTTLELLRPLPLAWAVRWLRISSRIAYHLNPGARRRTAAWLAETLPEPPSPQETERLLRDSFLHASFRRYLTYLLMRRSASDFSSMLEVEGWHHVEAALERKKGVLLLLSHVGFPRLLRWYLRTRDPHAQYILRVGFPDEKKHPWRARIFRWHRQRYHLDGDDITGDEDLSVQYMKRAHNHLRNNGIVQISGEGKFGTRRFPVQICGRQHEFPAGAMALGLISGATILPFFTVMDGAPRFRIEIQEPLVCPPGLERPDQMRVLVEAFAERVEQYIGRHPENVLFPRYAPRIPA